MSTLGYIGLGAMGARMCANLAKKSGQQTIGYDVNPDALAQVAAQGVKAADSVASLVAEADTIFICVPGEPEVRELCLGAGGVVENVRSGQTVVDMTTATPSVNREIAGVLAEKGVAFADAPVARGVPSAQDGTLAIMVGASDELYAQIKPLLECMGTDISHCGDVGTGQVVKLMNNMLVFQTVSALCEAMAIGTQAGVPRDRLFKILESGSADSFVLRRHGTYMTSGEYPDDMFRSRYSLKDVRYALDLADECAVDAQMAQVTAERLSQVVDKGWGDYYAPVMYKLFEK